MKASIRSEATTVDNRGQHISDSEEFLRDRVKALEAEVKRLEMALRESELWAEKYFREGVGVSY